MFIIAYYFCSTDDISWVLVAALITSWLGDVLLIPHGNGWFTAGGIIDLRRLFRDLKTRIVNPLDDGRVEGHMSVADRPPEKP